MFARKNDPFSSFYILLRNRTLASKYCDILVRSSTFKGRYTTRFVMHRLLQIGSFKLNITNCINTNQTVCVVSLIYKITELLRARLLVDSCLDKTV